MGWIGGTIVLSFIATLMLLEAREPVHNVTVVPKPIQAEQYPENAECLECNTLIYELRMNGETISVGDMESEEECQALIDDIDPQTPGFTELVCVPVWTQRERI